MGHGGNVIAELLADHREVEEIFDRMQSMSTGNPALRELVDEVTIELVRHSVAEEQYLYPAVREHVEGGDRIADKEIADHARIEELLKELEQLPPNDGRFHPLLMRLMDEVTAHVQDEEGTLFPRLGSVCSPRRSTTSATRCAAPSLSPPPGPTPPRRTRLPPTRSSPRAPAWSTVPATS